MFNFPNNFFDYNIKQMKSDVVYIVSVMKAIVIMDEINFKAFLETIH